MRLWRSDPAVREREAITAAYERGGDPVAILRSRLDASIAVRLALARRMRLLLVVALLALALSLAGWVQLVGVVNDNKQRVTENRGLINRVSKSERVTAEIITGGAKELALGEAGLCAIKKYIVDSGRAGSELFASLRVLKVSTALRIKRDIEAVEGSRVSLTGGGCP